MKMGDRARVWRNVALAAWAVAVCSSVCLGYALLRQNEEGRETFPMLGTTAIVVGPNGHAYKFVAAPNISWDLARAAAHRLSWRGRPGYLAVIHDAAEYRFVVRHIFGGGYTDVTYLGGRQVAPREWRWVEGPDAAADGGKGRLFWSGDEAGHAPPGMFAEWMNSAFQHSGKWDARRVCCVTLYSYGLPQFSTSLGNGYWEEGVAGYLVEFGG